MSKPSWRKTSQFLMPVSRQETAPGAYNVYPSYSLGEGHIAAGFDALARSLATAGQVTIDGFPGVLWQEFRERLHSALYDQGVSVHWVDAAQAMRQPDEIDAALAPYLGGDDPIFGFRFAGTLADFFQPEQLHALQPQRDAHLNIIFGCGAALAGWKGPLVYLDVPKNEIQFRQRAMAVRCLGASGPLAPKTAYKRSYFVDWPAANQHKSSLYSAIDWFVDAQRVDEVTFASGASLRRGLDSMANNFFRVRPWFEPGAWGGQWLRQRLPQLAQDVPNYAWSFELIVPENGIVLESDDLLLEVSFDFLMYRNAADITGEAAVGFGDEFPIRFDLLDTFDGGNLSVQCHPRPEYIRRHFGERYTQDETYYLLDCRPGARCYFGFQDGIAPREFRQALEDSFNEAQPAEIDRFVRSHPIQKHDLVLIPNGTIHCSGVNTMVLEISATPYIFTFKMYDWMRLDLDGQPRPLNIDRAFDNLYFDRQGSRVPAEFLSRPQVRDAGPGWQRVHLPTHTRHFYDVERVEFAGSVELTTDGSCQVMSLVEGDTVILETASGLHQHFNFAETFVVPAAAGSYRLLSESGAPLKVVKAFVKPPSAWPEGVLA